MLRLEGEVIDRKKGFTRNRPTSDFLNALPKLALYPMNDTLAKRVTMLGEEIRHVDFHTPQGFDDRIDFHPFGISGYRSYRFDKPVSRMMVVSPFLTNHFLESLPLQGTGHILVSRQDSLDELTDTTRHKFEKIYYLNEMAEADPREAPVVAGEDSEDATESSITSELSGLHAKLFICETSWQTSWLIGSANATDAAFRTNVEFMIEMLGKKSRIGIDPVLGNENDRNSLRSLLLEYTLPEKKLSADRNQKRAEELANAVREWLVKCNLALNVQPKGELYNLKLHSSQSLPPPIGIYTIVCRPVSVHEGYHRQFSVDQPINFENISLASLTAFIGFEVVVHVSKAKYVSRFVFLLPIDGLPPERDGAILSTILSNQTQFLRYLRLLLMENNDLALSVGWGSTSKTGNSYSGGWESLDMPLLEELIRALSRSNDPGGKIDRIAELVDRLKDSPHGQEVIPPDFYALWRLILQARLEI